MKIISFFTLLMIPGVVNSISVKGYPGGEVNITCKYDEEYTLNIKYFCKGRWATCSDRIRSDKKDKWVHSGRFSLYDSTRSAAFYVTIRNLSQWDSGTYYCAVDKYGIDFHTEVKLKVGTDPYLILGLSVSPVLIIMSCIVTRCKKRQTRGQSLSTNPSDPSYMVYTIPHSTTV